MFSKKEKHQVNFLDLDEETREDVLEYVGRNKEYYEKKWGKISNRKSIFSWNWSSLILGLFWFGYRKMNVYVYLLLGIFVVLDILSIILFKRTTLSTELAGMFIVIGLIANKTYFDFVLKKVQSLKNQYPNREERLLAIRKNGGVSWLCAIIFAFVLIIYTFSITFLEEKVYYAYAIPKFTQAAELQKSGQLEEAIDIYDDIENRNYPIPSIYYNKALIYGSKGEYKKALKHIETFLKLVPRDKRGLELKEELINTK
ncbi:DUF2628 domain-containing protein [Alkalihalobacillus sp. AL-G]|uniref:DUF2628 domain-containing protein n=1 Tax=Alkalihalobacillus sp. AL-G TaxID=2926399 RepID=UPI00272C3700|nr:DUF2628 domain-containing protein [Alkalihalobacillus sp. AL-G]WLD92877.1 DUF2628 domain-containing protein [Alkalihalobacillus sp. AL-G]